jgi:hypothetical protein
MFRMSKKTDDPLAKKCKSLGDAALSLVDRFVVGGSLESSLSIDFATVNGTPQTLTMSSALNNPDLASLKTIGTVAGFGHKGETKVDETVRAALEITPDKFTIHGFDPQQLLNTIREGLVPDAEEVTAELHKLNIYTEGCHFKSHMDTPRGEGSFGTLLIVLPVIFGQGSLTIAAPGISQQKVVYDFANTMIKRTRSYHLDDIWKQVSIPRKAPTQSSKGYHSFSSYGAPKDLNAVKKEVEEVVLPNSTIEWVAFFGDCQHEVDRVVRIYTYCMHTCYCYLY